jgi:OPA family glycerol-3-phosphate transporter-like MFS transporter
MNSIPAGFEDPAFRARRRRNWLLLGFLYAFFYMTRYNFAAVMVNLSSTFGWSNTQLGVFETMMPLVYGLSVVFNGPIADRVGGKRAFLFGAVGVTVMNLLFGACILAVQAPAVMAGVGHDAHVVTPAVLRYGFEPGQLLTLMAVIWGINGYFQSFGALSIVKVNAQWFHVRERGTFAGIFGVLIRFGLILSFSGVPLILTFLPLQFAFWLPGVFVAIVFALNLGWMSSTPKDAGYPGLDTGDGSAADDDKPASLSVVLKTVFASRVTWTIAASSMMIGMVRRSTIDSWYPKYFKEIHLGSAGASLASYLPYQMTVWGIACVGIAGGFAFGIASDRVFQGRRAPVIAIGFVGMIGCLTLFGIADSLALGPWAAVFCLSLLSFFVNGAHGMIGGAASMDFGGRKAAATAAGLFDGMQYLASSMVGIGMGYTLDHWGWKAWQWMPIPFALAGALLISRIWNATPRGHGARAAQPAARNERLPSSASARA